MQQQLYRASRENNCIKQVTEMLISAVTKLKGQAFSICSDHTRGRNSVSFLIMVIQVHLN